MDHDLNARRRAPVRWGIWLAAGAIAVLVSIRVIEDDAVEGFDAAVAALRAAETALDDAAVDLGAAADAPRGQDASAERPDATSDAARQAESSARAAGRASTQTRIAETRIRHMRLERPGTFAEAVAAVRALRNAARALVAAIAALRDAAEALRDAGAVRAAHRTLLAADAALDAAQTVLQATEAALGDERFDEPAPGGHTQAATGARRAATAPTGA